MWWEACALAHCGNCLWFILLLLKSAKKHSAKLETVTHSAKVNASLLEFSQGEPSHLRAFSFIINWAVFPYRVNYNAKMSKMSPCCKQGTKHRSKFENRWLERILYPSFLIFSLASFGITSRRSGTVSLVFFFIQHEIKRNVLSVT